MLCDVAVHTGLKSCNVPFVTVFTICHAAKMLFLGGAASSPSLKYINS